MIDFQGYGNDKMVVLTQPKNASRVCQTWFGENGKSIKIDTNAKKAYSEYTTHSELVSDLNKLISKTSKKDLFLFYRNPIERFKSGVYQEFVFSFSKDDNSPSAWFALHMKDGSDRFYNYIIDTNLLWSNDEIEDEFKEQLQDVIDVWLRWFFNRTNLSFTHTSNYLHALYSYTQLFGDDKLNLIDVGDIDVELIFKQYIDEIPKSKWDWNFKRNEKGQIIRETLKNIEIRDMINQSIKNNSNFQRLIDIHLKTEFYFYELLKEHNKNIISIKNLDN